MIHVHQKQSENVGYFRYLGSVITNDARCTHKIKCRIIMVKAAFNKQNTLYTRVKKNFHWEPSLSMRTDRQK